MYTCIPRTISGIIPRIDVGKVRPHEHIDLTRTLISTETHTTDRQDSTGESVVICVHNLYFDFHDDKFTETQTASIPRSMPH